MEPDRRVTVGRVTRPQGLKGEVRVSLFDCSVEVFRRLSRVTAVREDGPPRALTLEAVRTHGRAVIVKFAEAVDRSTAEGLVGCELEVPVEEIPSLAPGELYTYQLEGLEVIADTGERLGVLDEVLGLPAHDVYVVREGDREILLPATDEVIREIDLEKGHMIVHLLDGLLD